MSEIFGMPTEVLFKQIARSHPDADAEQVRKAVFDTLEMTVTHEPLGHNGDGTGTHYYPLFNESGLPCTVASLTVIKANWRKAVSLIPDVLLTSLGTAWTPFLGLVGLVWLALKAKDVLCEHLPKEESMLLLAVFKACEGKGKATEEEVDIDYEKICKSFGEEVMNRTKRVEAINKLSAIGAIRIADGLFYPGHSTNLRSETNFF